MSPWLIVGIVGYWAVAFWVASRLGGFLARTQAPPAGPRARLVRERERAGRVEFLPALGDAEIGQKAGRRR
jgi:hypothetical protein